MSPAAVVHVVRKRSRGQHPWVFSNEVQRAEGNPGPGAAVVVYERRRLLGSGVYNPNSLIRVRLYSPEIEDLDESLITRRLRAAAGLRERWLPGEVDFRLLYGESDQLPGLVVDKYGDHLVLQIYSAAVERRQEAVIAALRAAFSPACISEKNDFRLREAEGLDRREGLLYGQARAGLTISESGARFLVDIASGQKTGYYFDHRMTRRKVRALAAERSVLDVFSYTGSFAVNAALGGAREVVGIDASAEACNLAMRNAELNGVSDRCRFVAVNAFTALAELEREGRRFGLVCLDPPAFIKSAREKENGVQGYRRINALAMKLLDDGGILATSSCSHYLFWQDMNEMLALAAQDAGRRFSILDRSSQGPDHPVLLSMPESEYLRCFILQLT